MDARIPMRLSRLRQEFEAGQVKLRQLEVEQDYLRERLLMVKGAISVLEELSSEELSSEDLSSVDSPNGHSPAPLAGVVADLAKG